MKMTKIDIKNQDDRKFSGDVGAEGNFFEV